MPDTLNTYGQQFQIKVLSALITDRSFLSQIYDILNPDYFDSEPVKWLCKQTLFYFKEYRKVPTADVFKVQISGIDNQLKKQETLKAFGDIWKNLESTDLDFVKTTTLDFCRNQELRSAILKSVDLLKDGKYDDIKSTIDRAIRAGISENIGIDYLDDIDYRYEEDIERPRVPTGWKVLDDLLGGGMPRGKLGIISMPSGYGKSYFLSCIAANALKSGFNVFYYTLELDDKYVARRIDASITGIQIDRLADNIETIKTRLGRVKGRLIIKEYPTKRASLATIISHLDKMELLGCKPDLVIIDDPELLKLAELRDQRKDEQIQELYEEIRGVGKEKDFVTWVPSQLNRTGLAAKGPAGADSISASYGKIYTGDLVIIGDRRGEHKIKNTALFKIEKSRLGPDGMVLPAKFDTSRASIEIYEDRSEIGASIVKADPEYEQKLLAKKYLEMRDTTSGMF